MVSQNIFTILHEYEHHFTYKMGTEDVIIMFQNIT